MNFTASLRSAKAAAVGLLALAAVGLAILMIAAQVPVPDPTKADKHSPIVLGEDGSILTAYLSEDGYWRSPPAMDEVPEYYIAMLLAFEDKRFMQHGGIDPIAAVRAFWQLLRNGRVISGASTISMQTVRLLEGSRGGIWAKLRQSIAAVKLERKYSKREILSRYLTLAPFGGNVEGIRFASLRYFGKEVSQLTVAEAALLVALPQAPEQRRPDRNLAAAMEAKDRILRLMKEKNVLSEIVVSKALAETVEIAGSGYHFIGRHFADRVHRENPRKSIVETLIDRRLQQQTEELASSLAASRPAPWNCAILVVRNRDGAVRAYAGSGAYFDSSRAGMIDLVRAVRSPGSALKPLIYGLGFEDLLIHPSTIVSDQELEFPEYHPQNFDKRFRGDLSVREAVIASVNTVPILLLSQIGPEQLLSRLRQAGIDIVLPDNSAQPGLSTALGGLGITLEGLAKVYLAIANGGSIPHLRFLSADDARRASLPLLSADAAWAIADILADMPPPKGRLPVRAEDGGRRIGYKTGTSYGFRDVWAVGFDANFTVAIWAGRPDGVSNLNETAATTAVPVMFRIFDLLPSPPHDVASPIPIESILSRRNELPNRLLRFPGTISLDNHSEGGLPMAVVFPRNGSSVRIDNTDGKTSSLRLSVSGGRAPFSWNVEGRLLEPEMSSTVEWTPDGAGQYDIQVIDAEGRRALSSVWIEPAN